MKSGTLNEHVPKHDQEQAYESDLVTSIDSIGRVTHPRDYHPCIWSSKFVCFTTRVT